MELSTKRIRELIACPQFGDDHYGEWGCLAYDQRKAILHLVETIDRQQADIERLHSEAKEKNETIVFLKDQATGWSIEFCNLKAKFNTARTEAIKQFAERLKDTPFRFREELSIDWSKPPITKMVLFVDDNDIDNLVKEMTEDKP